jgi:hypothetical protein
MSRRQGEESGLTRISVRSSADYYLVRNGGGRAFKVRKRGRQLECECGAPNCEHIGSLRLCGFVDEVRELPMAA